jgi:hypothetical protein
MDERTPVGEPLPADPDAYDSPRATQARARGLNAPYIAGGLDPDPETTRRRERPYLVLLIAMIVVVALSGFLLGIIVNAIQATPAASAATLAGAVQRLDPSPSPDDGAGDAFVIVDDQTGNERSRGDGRHP